MISKAGHLYTTDPKLLNESGYNFEAITGYLFPDKFANTVALHHWSNPTTGRNFYTIEESQPPSDDGYEYQGIEGFLYRNPTRGTTPLFHWYHKMSGNHFYTTNPRGDFAPFTGYVFEGVTAYLNPEPLEGTTPLFRWFQDVQHIFPTSCCHE